MDERLGGKGLLVGFGALAIIFLCLMLCGLGAMATFWMRSGPMYGEGYIQPPSGEEGAVPPQVYYGPGGVGRHVGYGPLGIVGFGFSLLFKLLFFGLLLLLLVGLISLGR